MQNMTLEEGLLYVINAKKYIDVYGQSAFEAALEEFKVEDFSTFEYVPRDSALDCDVRLRFIFSK